MPRLNNNSRPPFLLIDADVLAYQAAAAAEKTICFDDDLCLPYCSLTDAVSAFEYKLESALAACHTQDYILAFSDASANNFRRTSIFPAYKMNREGKARPVALRFLREYIMGEYTAQTYLRPTLEADDCMGILATQASFMSGRQKVIVSIDKDLKSVPGWFYNIGKPELGIQEVTEAEADRWHMMQTLMGDATDGYPGCPKVGLMTAEKLLKDVPPTYADMWPVVVKTYDKQGLGEEFALSQARIARILRAEDYDFKNKKVKLWNPPIPPTTPNSSSNP